MTPTSTSFQFSADPNADQPSTEMLQAILGRIDDAVLVVSGDATGTPADFIAIYANRSFLACCEHSREVLLQMSVRHLFGDVSDPDQFERLLDAAAEGVSVKVSLRLRPAHSPDCSLTVQGFALPSIDGRPCYGLSARVSPGMADHEGNVTDLVEKQQALTRDRERLAAALDYVNEGFILTDATGKVILFNRKTLDLYPHLRGRLQTGLSLQETEHEASALDVGSTLALPEPGQVLEIWTDDDRCCRIVVHQVADGSRIAVFTEITETRHTERSLRESEQRFRALTEASPVGILLADKSGHVIYANPILYRMANHTGEQPLQQDEWQRIVHPDDLPNLLAVWQRCLTEFQSGEVQYRLAGRWMHAYATPVLDVGGQNGFIATVIDIHDRRMVEAALQESEKKFRRMVETAHEGVWVCDAEGVTTFANQRMADIMGYTVQEFIGCLTSDMVVNEDFDEQAYQAVVERQRQGISDQFEARLKRKDGGDVWALISTVPILDEHGTYLGATAMVADLTERHMAEQALNRHVTELEASRRQSQSNAERLAELARQYVQEKQRAEESSLAKSRFLSNVSHELRTPLNAILGFSDILRNPRTGPQDERFRSFADDIYTAGTYLLELINDILDMSKIEAGKYELRLVSVAPRQIIDDAVRLVRHGASENGLTMVLDIADTLPPFILADSRAMRQILLNLLSNAIKFTPSGGTVTLRAGLVDTHLTITITDTGIGIADTDLTRLGQPFEQIDSALNRRHQGTGLGLALSKSLAELHNGSLSIVSSPDAGTVVTVLLPIV